MIPKKPIVWLLLFVPALTLVDYYTVDSARTFLESGFFSLAVGVLTLLILYLGGKMCKKDFSYWGTQKNN